MLWLSMYPTLITMIGYKNFDIDHHYIYKLFIYAVILIFEIKNKYYLNLKCVKILILKPTYTIIKSTEMIESNL